MRKEDRGTCAADRIVKEIGRSCWGGEIRQRNAGRQAMGGWAGIYLYNLLGLLGFEGKRIFGCPETQACAPS